MNFSEDKEYQACTPIAVNRNAFNANCELPYGLQVEHVGRAMEDFIYFLDLVNHQLHAKGIPRLESLLMPAMFSGLVGELISSSIPKYCPYLARNRYPNGHPDLIPAGMFADDAIHYAHEGIEVKSSRRLRGWQGHNPEAVWRMVFCFDSNTLNDDLNKRSPKPFRFRGVYAAKLDCENWIFSGRSATSRRTITASVALSGIAKMKANWVYEDLS
ncbi:MAG TPA: hypothetical protein VKV18_11350 [Chthonomonas sp.]|uniref:hypothetical protein n=1 Tax=Chthonomonas sp. TaxID=2282153 RepID=UPI002B4AB489|nr:hypothetical protein [Chthonomonas sp.]HLI49269.1 hypothetical protein [Chthonomonas sp.]